jgi:TonB family protein
MARRFQVNPFDLLGQEEPFPIAVVLRGTVLPNLSIAWNSFHQNFFSELAAFFTWTRVPKNPDAVDVFRDCRVRRRIPLLAIAAAAACHVAFFLVPWPDLPMGAQHNAAFDDAELTWSGPIEDLPLLNVPKHAAKPARTKTRASKSEVENSEAFHPRQRIFTDPVQPTHPRQTLVRPTAPMEAPKVLASLPNMVELAQTPAPPRPRLEISEQTLSKLRPKLVKHKAADILPVDAPNLETRSTDISITTITSAPERPKLEISAGSAPRVAAQSSKGEAAAPELAAGNTDASETIIALSSSPAAPAAPAVEVPKGNLAARVAMSPEGKGNGSGAGNGANGGASVANENAAGNNSVGISISGGNPKPNASASSGNFGKLGSLKIPKTATGYKRADSDADDAAERNGPPNFAALPAGAPPEQIFATHRVYTMNVNMPNLNSATGSWIIHFSELRLPGTPRIAGELSAPVPLRKVDPKYPQTAMQEHIEGEVILYGVIRADGSVDSIQLVRGVDEQLDANAIAAFAQWKFDPASKAGRPIALEAIVHIPFRGREP